MPSPSSPVDLAAPAAARPRAGTVCWSASIAGAAAATALSLLTLVPLLLGKRSEFDATTLAWGLTTSLLAAGIGGYLAGWMRTRRVRQRHDEFFLNGPAHGLLAWLMAFLLTLALLAAMNTGARPEPASLKPDGSELLDRLFSTDAAAPAGGQALSASTQEEIRRIFGNTLQMGVLPSSDQRYLGQLLSRQSGLPRAQAEQRVGQTYALAREQLRRSEIANRQASDLTRQTFAYAALGLLALLLAGALLAGLAAAAGGALRATTHDTTHDTTRSSPPG
ncbi:hypothetical protein [Paucibacter sp. M5-1]|uniref:hypothetical protein n=1 Tax=Paucibacter sp. M5-1 TaxID=3015998 RepID=UPI0022B8C657|nr:hypothetical protein [Paucibacter sp. M5-1]MCZ7879723.1 hypothetical protein [Paucibacter sp. M5-1]